MLNEVNCFLGLPWQEYPNALGSDAQPIVIAPLQAMAPEDAAAEATPPLVLGIAAKNDECARIGAAPGCRACRANAKGDAARELRDAECLAIVIEWLNEQDDRNVQTRSGAA